MEFDETKAIAYIREKLPADRSAAIDDDEILNIIDMIWDYYEDHGMLDITADLDDEDDDTDPEVLISHVVKLAAKDRRCPLTAEDIDIITRAELEYEEETFTL